MGTAGQPERIELSDYVYWWLDGEFHREDGPAVEYADGTRYWYRNGLLHREEGPAIEHPNGDYAWFRNGQRHREDGPAVQGDEGTISWWQQGQLHREDGPAVEHADGRTEWWLVGIQVTWNQEAVDRWAALTPDQKSFTLAHLADVGDERKWLHWDDLFTSACDTCPAPSVNARPTASKRRSTQARAR